MSILHFNNRDYKIRKYDVYEEEDSVITQFVAEVILPDNLKTPEVWQAIEYLKASGYFFEVSRLRADNYCYIEGTLLDAKGNQEDYLPLAYLVKPQDYDKVRTFLIEQTSAVVNQDKNKRKE